MMRKFGFTVILVLALGAASHARTTPTSFVQIFYASYMEHQDDPGFTAFIKSQKAVLAPDLYDLLSDIADNDQRNGGPWLDFDPFINAQMNAATFSVGAAKVVKGLSYVPVSVSLRSPGHEKLAVTVVVGERNGLLQIQNLVYPPSDGSPGWNLLDWLHKQLKR